MHNDKSTVTSDFAESLNSDPTLPACAGSVILAKSMWPAHISLTSFIALLLSLVTTFGAAAATGLADSPNIRAHAERLGVLSDKSAIAALTDFRYMSDRDSISSDIIRVEKLIGEVDTAQRLMARYGEWGADGAGKDSESIQKSIETLKKQWFEFQTVAKRPDGAQEDLLSAATELARRYRESIRLVPPSPRYQLEEYSFAITLSSPFSDADPRLNSSVFRNLENFLFQSSPDVDRIRALASGPEPNFQEIEDGIHAASTALREEVREINRVLAGLAQKYQSERKELMQLRALYDSSRNTGFVNSNTFRYLVPIGIAVLFMVGVLLSLYVMINAIKSGNTRDQSDLIREVVRHNTFNEIMALVLIVSTVLILSLQEMLKPEVITLLGTLAGLIIGRKGIEARSAPPVRPDSED